MHATKYTVTVVINVLSMDSVSALLEEVQDGIYSETTDGSIHKSDGDEVKWTTESNKVKF